MPPAALRARSVLAGMLGSLLLLAACGEGRAPVSVPPLAIARITSPFGTRDHHPIRRNSGPVHHDGFDLAAPAGSPIYAARPGRVVFAGSRGGYGLMIEVEHAGGLSTGYAHASRLAVRAGQIVQGGEILGFVGSTGLATGPHLHYEVRLGGKAIDPREAGFALAADIRTGRVPRARLASYETVSVAAAPAARARSGPTSKIKRKRADKVRTAKSRPVRDPRVAETRLKAPKSILVN